MFRGCRRKGHTCISSFLAHNLHIELPYGCVACWYWVLASPHMVSIHYTCAHKLVGLTLFCLLLFHISLSCSLMIPNPAPEGEKNRYSIRDYILLKEVPSV